MQPMATEAASSKLILKEFATRPFLWPRTRQTALFALVFAITMLPNRTTAAGKIYYGSRVGMTVTVRSMEGLDTSHATIRTEHTREDAEEFCKEYSQLSPKDEGWSECIKQELATRINDVVTANCVTGVFTNFFGDRFRFLGPNRRKAEIDGTTPEYLVRDLGSGQLLGNYSATGYSTNLSVFAALCPRKAPTDIR
jgi:hypothetical protein